MHPVLLFHDLRVGCRCAWRHGSDSHSKAASGQPGRKVTTQAHKLGEQQRGEVQKGVEQHRSLSFSNSNLEAGASVWCMLAQAKEACSRALTIFGTCLGESHELCQEQKARLRMLR